MIIVDKNSENKIVITVSQDTGINYSHYLFVFESLMRAATVKFTSSDVSEHPSRFNLFEITETATANVTSSEAYFEYEGDYKYKVYGKYENDLNVPSGVPLETGFARVQGTNYTYTATDSNFINKAYDPDQV